MKIGYLVIYKDMLGMVIDTSPMTIATNTGQNMIVEPDCLDPVMTDKELIATFRRTICNSVKDV